MVSMITESQTKLQNWPPQKIESIVRWVRHFTNTPASLPNLISKCTAEQFPDDFSASGEMLYCKFIQRNVDSKCVDMCKDHFQANTHVKNKENTVLVMVE